MENALKEKTLLKKFVDVYLEMSHLQKSFPSAPVHFPFVRKQLWWNSKSIWKDIFTMKENVYIVVLRAVVSTGATGAVALELFEELLNKNSVFGLLKCPLN